jgi:hypothetical protein
VSGSTEDPLHVTARKERSGEGAQLQRRRLGFDSRRVASARVSFAGHKRFQQLTKFSRAIACRAYSRMVFKVVSPLMYKSILGSFKISVVAHQFEMAKNHFDGNHRDNHPNRHTTFAMR